jgi:hypothetical protein
MRGARSLVQTYEGATVMSFAVEEDPGSKRLLVAFPKLRAGAARPPVVIGHRLEGLPGHRLYLGADRDRFIGPNRQLLGLRTAVEIVGRESTRMGVPRENVVFFGTSASGGFALMVGLAWGAGTVVGGGVPVLGGTVLRRMIERGVAGGGGKKAAVVVLESARQGDADDDPVSFLDGLFFRLAEALQEPVTAHFITSPADYVDADVRRFVEFADRLPHLHVMLHEGSYDRHNLVRYEFFALLRKVAGPAADARAG